MIVTLTDFGDNEYLGIMKGVIYKIFDKAKIVDLFNHIKAQSVKEGAWVLFNNYHRFPNETIFLCVVDPSVGGGRQAVVIRTENYFFVGPDNGLMYPAANKDGIKEVFLIDEETISNTFHGRDVFAVGAAKIEQGLFEGKTTRLEFDMDFENEIVRIDSFGNIITSVPNKKRKNYSIKVGKHDLNLNFYKTYEEAPKDTLFLIEGSCKTLELSVKNDSAFERLNVKIGDKVEIGKEVQNVL